MQSCCQRLQILSQPFAHILQSYIGYRARDDRGGKIRSPDYHPVTPHGEVIARTRQIPPNLRLGIV